jgi:predicted transcriptional regulator
MVSIASGIYEDFTDQVAWGGEVDIHKKIQKFVVGALRLDCILTDGCILDRCYEM